MGSADTAPNYRRELCIVSPKPAAVPGLDCHTLKKRFEAAANGRVGFIAREPFQSLRNHFQASGKRSRWRSSVPASRIATKFFRNRSLTAIKP